MDVYEKATGRAGWLLGFVTLRELLVCDHRGTTEAQISLKWGGKPTVLTPDEVTGLKQGVNRCNQWTSVRELIDQLRR